MKNGAAAILGVSIVLGLLVLGLALKDHPVPEGERYEFHMVDDGKGRYHAFVFDPATGRAWQARSDFKISWEGWIPFGPKELLTK